jgi:hypothetical protein
MHPVTNATPIGWIAENTFTFPGLNQSILFLGEIPITLVVLCISARIQREVKFFVQLVKECLWGCPLICYAAEHQFSVHSVYRPFSADHSS